MATDSKDVELRIRARDYSQKTLNQVTGSLDDLTKAQEEQIKAAKRGEVSAAALEASYGKIEKVVQALVKQGSLAKVFDDQAAALAKAKQRADEARTAQAAYAASIADGANLTKKQVADQEKLAKAVASADKAQLNAQNRLDRTAAKLTQYGIAADQVAVAQQRIVAAVAQGNAALERQDAALETVTADIARKAAADRDAAVVAQRAAAAQAEADRAAVEAARQAAAIEAKTAQQRQRSADAIFEAAQAEKQMSDAMRISAQQAEATARGYQTLARSVTSVRGDELRKQIEGITNPSKAAASNLQTLETTVTSLQNRINAINGPVKNFRATLQELETAQRGMQGIAAQIDGYRRQMDVLREARAEYALARTSVKSLTDQMRAGGGDAAELGRQLTVAQNQLKAAAQGMSQQTTRTRDLRAALRDAGVDTRNLAAAEQQLVSQATRATSTVDALTAAYKKHGAAVEGAAKSQFKFFDGGRTTLSYTQRLRGELLALATAYIGVQGAIGLATGSLDAYKKAQKIEGQLGALVGNDAKLIREEWDYLIATADRIGLSFESVAGGYAKLGIAAKSAGLTQQETRFIFERFAEAARVAGQSTDEFEGTLKAVEQMLSKGKIQAEELRGQLGDRLAGAFTIAAKAAGLTTAEFDKMMEQGQISSEYLINIARELGNTYKGADKAAQTLAAAQARFETASFLFKKALAENGFAETFTDFLNKLTALLNSEQGAELAKGLGQVFSAVVDVLRLLADNIETVKTALSVLIGIGVFNWAMGAAAGITKLGTVIFELGKYLLTAITALRTAGTVAAAAGTAATGAATGVAVFRTALLSLGRAIPVLGALLIAIEAATYAYNKLKGAKQEAANENDPEAVVTRRQLNKDGTFAVGGTADPGTGGDAGKRAAAEINKQLEDNQKKLDKAAKSARKKSAKDDLDERKDLINEEFNLLRKAAQDKITDATTLAKTLETIDKQNKQALLTEEVKFQNENARAGAASANKKVQLQEQIKNELLRIQDDLAKQETKLDKDATFEDRRKTRLDAIAHSYDKLKKTIKSLEPLDKAGADNATEKLNVYIKQLQGVEDIKVTLDEIKRLEKELSDQQKLRADLIEQEKAKYDAGLISQKDFLSNAAEINLRADSAIKTAAQNLQTFTDAAIKARDDILSLTEQSDIKTKVTTAVVGANSRNANADAAIKAQEDAINALVEKRSLAEALLKAQLDQRLIGEDEYARRVNANSEQYKANIMAQIQALLSMVEAQRAQGVAEGTLNQERINALDQMILKYQALGVSIGNAALQADSLQRFANEFVSKGLDTALNAAADALTQMATGQMSVADGFKSMLRASLQFFASFMMDIAKAIIKQMLLNALAGMGGPFGAAARVAGGVASGVNHRGGVVGVANATQRMANPSWFANAPRFHEGGLPGLRSDEVPSILQKGEEVLTRDDPRNVLNGGGGNNAGTRFVLVDDRSKVPEAMQSSEGERVIVETIKRNASTIKTMMR